MDGVAACKTIKFGLYNLRRHMTEIRRIYTCLSFTCYCMIIQALDALVIRISPILIAIDSEQIGAGTTVIRETCYRLE